MLIKAQREKQLYIELWLSVFKRTKRGLMEIDGHGARFVEGWKKGNYMKDEKEKIKKRNIFS